MVERFEIPDFKCVRGAIFERCAAVNLVTGRSGSGKTSVLEWIAKHVPRGTDMPSVFVNGYGDAESPSPHAGLLGQPARDALALVSGMDPDLSDLKYEGGRPYVLSARAGGWLDAREAGAAVLKALRLASAIQTAAGGVLAADGLETFLPSHAVPEFARWFCGACLRSDVQAFASTSDPHMIAHVCAAAPDRSVLYRLEPEPGRTFVNRFSGASVGDAARNGCNLA